MSVTASYLQHIRTQAGAVLPKEVRTRLMRVVRWVACAAAGAVLARTGVIGGLYPFGAAYAACLPHGLGAAGAAGIIAGYVLPGDMPGRLRYIAAVLAVVGIKWALAEFRQVRRSPAFAPAAAFAGTMLTGLVVSSSSGASVAGSAVLFAAEGMLSAAAAFFFSGTAEMLAARGKALPDARQLCCAAAAAAMISIPLCRIELFGFSPVRCLLLVCLLLAARLGRETGAGAVGAALAASMVLSGEPFALAGVCAGAGMIAALFAPAGGIVSASAFMAVCSLGIFASGSIDLLFLLEALIASVAAPLIRIQWLRQHLPAWVSELLLHGRRNNDARPCHAEERSPVSCRLLAAADGLSGVSQTVAEVSDRLGSMDTPEPGQIYRRATKKICRSCAVSGHCWGEAGVQMTELFDSLTGTLRRDGALTRATSPEGLKKQCLRWGEMCEEINRLYADFAARERARRRVAQVRSVVTEQLGGVSELLCELAGETDVCSDRELAEQVRIAAADSGYTAGAVSCVRDAQGRLSVQLSVTGRQVRSLSRTDLICAIAERLDTEFLPARLTGSGTEFTVELVQRPLLRVEFGAAQHCCAEEQLCGDSYDALLDDSGGAVLLLSDGMGSGGRAAVDSAMTCGLLGQLLRAGFGLHSALRMVNSALLIKSDDESLSTADCLRMSLYTGEASFCKAGAAQSFILHDGQVSDIDIPSLPLGIMRELDCGTVSLELSAGDTVVMVSDGAIAEDTDWLRDELERFDGSDPRGLARSIVSIARAARSGSGDDDITALVMAVKRS